MGFLCAYGLFAAQIDPIFWKYLSASRSAVHLCNIIVRQIARELSINFHAVLFCVLSPLDDFDFFLLSRSLAFSFGLDYCSFQFYLFGRLGWFQWNIYPLFILQPALNESSHLKYANEYATSCSRRCARKCYFAHLHTRSTVAFYNTTHNNIYSTINEIRHTDAADMWMCTNVWKPNRKVIKTKNEVEKEEFACLHAHTHTPHRTANSADIAKNSENICEV